MPPSKAAKCDLFHVTPEIRTQTNRAVFRRGKKRAYDSDSEAETSDTPVASSSRPPLTLKIKKREFLIYYP